MSDRVRVFAPGGIGNIGPGLDILGCAVAGPGDVVVATREPTPGIRLGDPGHPDLPKRADVHTAAIAAREVLRRIGVTSEGLKLDCEKGLPLSGGQGGSAASAIAGAVAANAIFGERLDRIALLECALAAESRVAGRHADNLAASLYGGIVLIRGMDPLEIISLPVPDRLRIVLVHPHQRLSTSKARRVLPPQIDLKTAMTQAAHVATMVHALHRGDLAAFGRAIDDRIAEPARLPLLPGFAEAKRAALENGALGCSISGAGPTVFAVVDDEQAGSRVCNAMIEAYRARGIEADGRVSRVDEQGARSIESGSG